MNFKEDLKRQNAMFVHGRPISLQT